MTWLLIACINGGAAGYCAYQGGITSQLVTEHLCRSTVAAVDMQATRTFIRCFGPNYGEYLDNSPRKP